MTFKRFIIALLSIPILSYWLILSPVIPNSENHPIYYKYSDNGRWKIGIYNISATTPISSIQYLLNRRYVVLYKSDGEYIGQSTPFCFQSFWGFNALFPNNTHNSLLFIPESCDYTIPTDKPKWWSKIIKFRLSL